MVTTQQLDASGSKYIGMCLLQRNPESGGIYHEYTGVHREFRGRGIAYALKLAAVRKAREYQAPYLRTDNHSQNAPMLAINRRMGYRPMPGHYAIFKPLV